MKPGSCSHPPGDLALSWDLRSEIEGARSQWRDPFMLQPAQGKRCLFWVFLFLVKLPIHRPLSIFCACSPALPGLCLQETWPSSAFPSPVSWSVLKPPCTSQLLLLLSRVSRVRLCSTIDGSPPGSSVPRILQARTLGWVAISFSSAWKWKMKAKSFSCVRLFLTPWTAAYQAPLSMGFSRQEYWSGLPLPSPPAS